MNAAQPQMINLLKTLSAFVCLAFPHFFNPIVGFLGMNAVDGSILQYQMAYGPSFLSSFRQAENRGKGPLSLPPLPPSLLRTQLLCAALPAYF